MKKVLLVCNAGMSTGFLVKSIEKIVAERGLKIEFNESPQGAYIEKIKDYDLICVAPQLKFAFDEIAAEVKQQNKPCYQIQQKEYVPVFAGELVDNIVKLL